MAEANATQEQEIKDQAPAAEGAPGVPVQEAQLQEAPESGPQYSAGPVDILMDTTVPVSACLGQVELEVRQLLQMGKGSIVKLDTQVGELVDLYLRGIRFARGKLVVVGDKLGVRIEEVLPAGPDQPAKPAAQAGGKV